jgi:hypothetical protein
MNATMGDDLDPGEPEFELTIVGDAEQVRPHEERGDC